MFFFDIYPYIAGTVFLVGSWLRYDYGQYTWRAASSQMLDRKGMNLASNLFHIGILGIFAGHFLGMLTPHWMYESFLPIDVKQKMAMIAGGACGVMTLVGGLLLLKRRKVSPRVRATTTGADIMILSLLMVQCALGLLTIPFSAQHMDGSEMMKLVGWAQSVVTFHGGASTASGRRGVYFPRAPGLGDDAVCAVPVLPSGAYLERAGRVPDAQIPDCSRPSLICCFDTNPALAGFFSPQPKLLPAAANRISAPPNNWIRFSEWPNTRLSTTIATTG
ncbi:nitrate reductase A subunit gamma [Klebsiella michiganensis]|nr:nitrate reductase A subunit gamma [Klebsiella michiganensis]